MDKAWWRGAISSLLLSLQATQQAILSTYCVPGTVPGGDTKMSQRVPSLRQLQSGKGGRSLNKYGPMRYVETSQTIRSCSERTKRMTNRRRMMGAIGAIVFEAVHDDLHFLAALPTQRIWILVKYLQRWILHLRYCITTTFWGNSVLIIANTCGALRFTWLSMRSQSLHKVPMRQRLFLVPFSDGEMGALQGDFPEVTQLRCDSSVWVWSVSSGPHPLS